MTIDETKVEAAAREFCRLMGADPDEPVAGPDPRYPTLLRTQPRWMWQAASVLADAAMQVAIHRTGLVDPAA